jgi:uncharacterized membrane protein YphA (DoxX/SURF4 family)
LNYSSSNRGIPAGNPIANALVVVVGALAIGASVVLGFFAFLVLACLITVFAAIIGIRVWWFKRKLGKAARQHQANTAETAETRANQVIEGEFRVVSSKAPDPDGDRSSR